MSALLVAPLRAKNTASCTLVYAGDAKAHTAIGRRQQKPFRVAEPCGFTDASFQRFPFRCLHCDVSTAMSPPVAGLAKNPARHFSRCFERPAGSPRWLRRPAFVYDTAAASGSGTAENNRSCSARRVSMSRPAGISTSAYDTASSLCRLRFRRHPCARPIGR